MLAKNGNQERELARIKQENEVLIHENKIREEHLEKRKGEIQELKQHVEDLRKRLQVYDFSEHNINETIFKLEKEKEEMIREIRNLMETNINLKDKLEKMQYTQSLSDTYNVTSKVKLRTDFSEQSNNLEEEQSQKMMGSTGGTMISSGELQRRAEEFKLKLDKVKKMNEQFDHERSAGTNLHSSVDNIKIIDDSAYPGYTI